MEIITIDGPSGAGKGTICRILAERKNYHLLDSGAMYRIAAYAALKAGVDFENEASVASLAANLDIKFVVQNEATRVLLDSVDVTEDIRKEEAGMAASKVAALPKVRAALLDRQRAFAQEPGLVADGRDMGTVVFPDARRKFFLTASAEERARRRVIQLKQSGQCDIDEEKILADIKQRDYQDTHRATAPLVAAEDAITVDSTKLTIDQVVEQIEAAC